MAVKSLAHPNLLAGSDALWPEKVNRPGEIRAHDQFDLIWNDQLSDGLTTKESLMLISPL